MKIVYIYPSYHSYAGTERILIDKMNYLSEQYGYDIVMLTYDQGKHPLAYPISRKVTHIDLDIRFYALYQHNILIRIAKEIWLTWLLKKRMISFLCDFQPNIIIATTYHAKLFPIIAKCPINAIRILESHIDRFFILNEKNYGKNIFKYLLTKLDTLKINKYIKSFDLLVTLSNEDSKTWSKYITCRTITNMVHLNDGRYFSSLSEKTALFAGRFEEQKGIPDLLEIWKIVNKKHPDWKLEMYGDGGLYDIFYKEVKSQNINIHIHKSTKNIFEIYKKTSILLVTSLYEPFGLVMPEAMSCGIPVVAFNCPHGPAQIITNGVNGYVIDNRDINQFATQICKLIEDQNLRLSFGEKAMQSAQRYKPDAIMPIWKSLFEEITKKQKK